MRLIVPVAAGGPTDIVARLIGQWLSERLHQPFIVENRSGAGSAVVAIVGQVADAAAASTGEHVFEIEARLLSVRFETS